MAVGLDLPGRLTNIAGIRLSTASAGIYKRSRTDIALIELDEGGSCSAVFTRNAFAAAPVEVAREHIADTNTRFCLINAGNANAGTGAAGLASARKTCEELAALSNCRSRAVLPFSTGVIGEPFPAEKINSSLPTLYAGLQEDNWLDVAKAIMTTDTAPKALSRTVMIENSPVTITGIAKGAGMIRPDMATMLAFIGTDANIEKTILDQILSDAVKVSFNRICVDGDTSTNDACVLLASGKAPIQRISSSKSKSYKNIRQAVIDVCTTLAQAIVRDGEGATKFITVEVDGGRNRAECLRVAYAVATSALVKTAFFASDPNWGRILAATGRAGVRDLNIEQISMYLDDILVVERGSRSVTYSEEAGRSVMEQEEITVRILLNRGRSREKVWTCDISHEYVRINAEYRT